MRRPITMVFGVTLLAAVSSWAAARAQDSSPDDSKAVGKDNRSWWDRVFNDDDEWRPKKFRPHVEKAPEKKPVLAEKKLPSKHETEIAELKKEQAAYLRRLAVCDCLKEIALKTGDQSLARQAEQLDAQAYAVYSKHVAHLGVKNIPAESTEDVLDIPAIKSKGEEKP